MYPTIFLLHQAPFSQQPVLPSCCSLGDAAAEEQEARLRSCIQQHCCRATALQTEGLSRSSGRKGHSQLLPRKLHQAASSHEAALQSTNKGTKVYYTPGTVSNSSGTKKARSRELQEQTQIRTPTHCVAAIWKLPTTKSCRSIFLLN